MPPSFQRHAALMRHELEEKGYEEGARGPAVAERCVHLQNSSVRGTSCSCDDLPQQIFSVKLRTSSKSFSSCTIQDGVVNEPRAVEARHDTALRKLSQNRGDSSQSCQHLAVLLLQAVKSSNEPGSPATAKIARVCAPCAPDTG